MKSSSHRMVTAKAFEIWSDLMLEHPHDEVMAFGNAVADATPKVDDYLDLEIVDVEGLTGSGLNARDDPHSGGADFPNDIAKYAYEDYIYSAFHHFIDIKKGPGLFDDYDGYSYSKGSASTDEYQPVTDVYDDWRLELVAWFTGNDKVDEFINWWLNDEYVHVPGDEWYRGCSPAVERYSAPETSYDTAQIKHRFPVADSIHYPNNGVPYSVFMPVDNMARFWYEFFVATCHGPALSAVMHAIQDAGVPHHAAGYNGNWHGRFESDYDRLMSACLGDHGFADRVKQLYSLWTGNNNPCPVLLGESQWQLVPSMIWRIDQLVTWVALNAYREYAKTYDHYRQGYVFYPATAMWLAEITTAMCILVLTKSQRDRTARSGFNFSLRSANYPSRYLRHANFLGKLDELATLQDRADATFRLVPGIAQGANWLDPRVSFESANHPGHFLRHQNWRLKLQPYTGDQLFKEDATFVARRGLSDERGCSFESLNHPGYFIRHKNFSLFVEKNTTEALFWQDATFLPVNAALALYPTTEYRITVVTGDRAWAGTDADVYVTLIGKNGLRSGDTFLDNADSNFEQGKTDTFDVTLRDVGDLDCIQISHDNSGAYPGWFLVGVAVEHLPTHRVWTCRCNRWLAFDEDDHRISRILPALSYPLGLRQSLTRIGRRPPVRIPSELKVPSKSLRETLNRWNPFQW